MFRERVRRREREKRGERNIDVREKHRLVASCMHPNHGLNPQLRHVPWLGIEPANFGCTGQRSKQLSHLAKAEMCYSYHLCDCRQCNLPITASPPVILGRISLDHCVKVHCDLGVGLQPWRCWWWWWWQCHKIGIIALYGYITLVHPFTYWRPSWLFPSLRLLWIFTCRFYVDINFQLIWVNIYRHDDC